MAITYNPNIPQATDQISQSQALILQNFQGITSLIGIDHATFPSANAGFHNQVTFVPQSPKPTYASGNIGLFSFLSPTSSTNQIYVTNSAGVTSPVTLASNSVNGWTILPCGLLLGWGRGTVITAGNQVFNWTTLGMPTAFTGIYMAIVSTNDVPPKYAQMYNYSNSSVSVNGTADSTGFTFMVIGTVNTAIL